MNAAGHRLSVTTCLLPACYQPKLHSVPYASRCAPRLQSLRYALLSLLPVLPDRHAPYLYLRLRTTVLIGRWVHYVHYAYRTYP